MLQGTCGYHKVNENGRTQFLYHTGEFYDAERNVTPSPPQKKTVFVRLFYLYILIVLIAEIVNAILFAVCNLVKKAF